MAFRVKLIRVRTISPSTRDFQFQMLDDGNLDYKPGQFYRFVFTDEDGKFERSYSLCNFSELYGNTLDLVISQVDGGRATRLLFRAEPGLEADVTGPFGRLILPPEKPGRLILVATSVGLAPYMPILKQLESADYSDVRLLLGVRDKQEFIYGEVLLDYAVHHSWFDLTLCLSREAPTEDWEATGYVTSQLKTMAVDPEKDHVLLCGNPAMIDDAYDYLKSEGFKPRQVIREKYVFAREKSAKKQVLSDAQKKLIAEKTSKYQS